MNKTPSVIYEMLRSFVSVADTLNISKAVVQLGFTRQTIRRHLDDLEEISGGPLFEVRNRQYHLTTNGEKRIAGAKELLSSLDDWVFDRYHSPQELKSIVYRSSALDYIYYLQQHCLMDVWDNGVPLIKNALTAWSEANAQLENSAFDHLREYLLIYRKARGNWLCTYVGQKSSYVSWLGLTWAQSAVGKVVGDDESNHHDHKFVVAAYDSVLEWGAPKYDHIHTAFSRDGGTTLEPVNYQRLLIPLRLPDGDTVLGSMVARTNQLDFSNLDVGDILPISDDLLMENSP
ncbi:MAG: LysR family transcriptional regulator [Rhizobiaceae bacterium]|nr:LysR family transcriptional regulator [Rhizobiaceae bacterium]